MNYTATRTVYVPLVIFTLALLPFLSAHAEERERTERERDDRTTVSTPAPTPPPAPPPPSSHGGGITSSTSGGVDTGGNTGGQVETGDERVEVIEINIGPTNPPPAPPQEVVSPPEGSEDGCDDRRSCDTRESRGTR